MKLGLLIYGSLDALSGGYLYDRMLVDYLRAQGDTVEIISLPWRNYAAHLTDIFWFRLPKNLDILIQDELNHPSLIRANRGKHRYPIISLVHHLRCSERRPKWQNDFYRVIEKKYLRSVDGFIFNSRTTQRTVRRVLENRGVESSKPEVVAFPPTDRFGEAIPEDEIIERAKQQEFRILFLGNVIERKGLHTLLEALGQIGNLPCRLDVIGSLTADPAYAKAIQDQISTNHLSSFIFLHNSLNNESLQQLLRQAHILCVPSSYEGFGIVYLEGMGFGLPAIGTTAGAAGEIITNGETGFLIEPNDSAALASCISQLASNRDLLTRLSLAARTRALRQPKWTETAGKIREFLLSVIASRAMTKQLPHSNEIASSGRGPSSQ
ncbi:MAG: glycosyltransferase family 4 protein [Chloroflexi bacterium]|nr:glycosyltransferase family 4 protein [Chloroflexota bacterium]